MRRAEAGQATNKGHSIAGIVLGAIAALVGIVVTAATIAVAGHAGPGHRDGGLPSMSALPSVSAPVADRTDPSSPIAGDGTYTVPNQMTPGTWQTAGPSESAVPMCYWARLNDLSGNLTAIKASDLSKGQATVTVAAVDAGFTTSGCAPWTKIS
jgi:hypothetical protein